MNMSPEQRREYQAEYRRRRRSEAVASLGGKCSRCGSTSNLDFNHVDPSTKSFHIARGYDKPKAVFWAEVAKCNLLCTECHKSETREQYARGDLSFERQPYVHGTLRTYREQQCRCEPCREAKRLSR